MSVSVLISIFEIVNIVCWTLHCENLKVFDVILVVENADEITNETAIILNPMSILLRSRDLTPFALHLFNTTGAEGPLICY